jgi:hypothetical protein
MAIKKTAGFYKMSHANKICYLSGVPEVFLKNNADFSFSKISYTDSKTKKPIIISATSQKDVFTRLFDAEVINSNLVIGIGSDSTEDAPMQAAVSLLKFAIEKLPHLKFEVVNLALYEDQETKKEFFQKDELDLLVIHGITKESSESRIQVCRDFIRAFEGTNRLVLIAGQDPYTFFKDRLRITPDLVFMVADKNNTVRGLA